MEDQKENIEELGEEVATYETAFTQFTKAEIDMQISTAKFYPRSLTQFRKKALSMATFSEEVAASCAYALPRAGKTLEGPSVRLAEIVVCAYGNLRAGARVIDNDGRTITAQGVCHDLENNTVVTIEVKRRITDKNGKTFNDDMQVVTGNAANAIAFRNAVFKIIPAAMIADIYDDVKKVAIGNAETLVKRRNKAVEFFTTQAITLQQICDVLQIKEIEDIDLDRLGILTGMRAAARNGESTLQELFTLKDTEPPAEHPKTQRAIKATQKIINQKRAKK